MKKKIISILILLSCICVFFLFKKFIFLEVGISKNFKLRQVPFCNTYNIYCKNKKVISNVYEWIITDRYIYGYGKNDFYIFEIDSQKVIRFAKEEDFYKELKKLGLSYNISDYKTPLDYRLR